MLSNRARRIAYLEKLIDLRKHERKRLLGNLKENDSLEKKVRMRGYLSRIETEMEAELSEIEALSKKS